MIRYGDAPIWGLQSHPETKPRAAKSLLLLEKVFRDLDSEEIAAALCQTARGDEIVLVVERFLAAGQPR